MAELPPAAVMHRAADRRDRDFDGIFVVAVRTTRIFCRPSCPARALARNRGFFASNAEAMQAGYRPCLRCRPLDVGGALPSWMGELVGRVDADPSARLPDKELRSLGVEPVQARRAFRKHFGMTFQAYCRGRRLATARTRLEPETSLDTVALDHGYESLSGFRDAFAKAFGSTPRKVDRGCAVVSWVESPVSPLLLAATDAGLCSLEFVGRDDLKTQMGVLHRRLGVAVVPGTHAHIHHAKRELGEYFAGGRRDFTVPLDPHGTPFQRAVWNQLLRIPYGETWSYQDLARAVKKSPAACRAVGQANGRNPISIIVPCHRVINKGGAIGGYGGELWRKRFLLALERGSREQ